MIIFLHGGGFIFGEANRDWYGPDYFIRQNVVLVVVQYRLGVFGKLINELMMVVNHLLILHVCLNSCVFVCVCGFRIS